MNREVHVRICGRREAIPRAYPATGNRIMPNRTEADPSKAASHTHRETTAPDLDSTPEGTHNPRIGLLPVGRQPGRDSYLRSHLCVSPPALFSGKKSCVDLHAAVKTTRRAISDVVVLNCESFTRYSHRRFDNNYFQRVAPLSVEALPGTTHRFNAVGLVDWVRLVLRERQQHQGRCGGGTCPVQ